MLSTSCGKNFPLPPLVSFRQLDLSEKNKPLVNSFEITKYNSETCRLELKEGVTTGLFDPAPGKKYPFMHGAICLDPLEYTKYRTWAETECVNAKGKK